MVNYSKRAIDLPESPLRKLAPFANKAKEKGIKVYHLNIGQPDIESPRKILNQLKNFKEKIIRYTHSQGEEAFLKAFLNYYHELGFTDLTNKNLIVTTGGSEAILWAFLAVCNPRDGVIVFEPFYTNYRSFAQMAQVNLIPVTLKIKNGFHLPEKKVIERKISSKTKAILICNPSNPTGTVFTKKEIEILIRIAKKNNLFLLSDEVYREFTYDGKKSISLLEFSGKNLVVLDSLSKRYSLCGARLGGIISRDQALINLFLKMGQARLSAPFIEQKICATINTIPKNYFKKVNHEYEARRDLVYSLLKKIPGVVCQKPEGAFYIIAKLPVDNAERFSKWLLTDFRQNGATVMLAPAAGFYSTPGLGNDEVRIAYVLNRQDLKKAMKILEKALKVYQRRGD